MQNIELNYKNKSLTFHINSATEYAQLLEDKIDNLAGTLIGAKNTFAPSIIGIINILYALNDSRENSKDNEVNHDNSIDSLTKQIKDLDKLIISVFKNVQIDKELAENLSGLKIAINEIAKTHEQIELGVSTLTLNPIPNNSKYNNFKLAGLCGAFNITGLFLAKSFNLPTLLPCMIGTLAFGSKFDNSQLSKKNMENDLTSFISNCLIYIGFIVLTFSTYGCNTKDQPLSLGLNLLCYTALVGISSICNIQKICFNYSNRSSMQLLTNNSVFFSFGSHNECKISGDNNYIKSFGKYNESNNSSNDTVQTKILEQCNI